MRVFISLIFVMFFGSCGQRSGSEVMNHNSREQFTNWLPGEPNNVGNQDCVMAVAGGGWRDAECSDRKFFACQSMSHPESWEIDTGRAEWHDYAYKCRAGYTFSAPKNARDVLNLNDAMGENSVWINLTDEENEGEFLSAQDSEPNGEEEPDEDEQTYFNWAPGEPTHTERENCVLALVGGRWRDTQCSDGKFFACQSLSNPDRWDVDSNRGAWSDHRNRCKRGYRFAAPQSDEDVLHLNNAMGDDEVWINVTDRKYEGHWVNED
jgi:hypothetical protein